MEAARGDLESVGCQETRPWRLHRKRRTEPGEDVSAGVVERTFWKSRGNRNFLPTHAYLSSPLEGPCTPSPPRWPVKAQCPFLLRQ